MARCRRDPLTSGFVDMGVYESLLTAKLFKRLTEDDDLRAEYGSVDEAEQALTIARHLAPIIERSLRAAGTAEDRAELGSADSRRPA